VNLTPRQHLRAALSWLVDILDEHMAQLARRGRAPMGAPLAGVVIEDGEALGLIDELGRVWSEGKRRETQWGELARTYKLTGGEIKNAVLAGAYAAARAGRLMGQTDLLEAVKRELRKTGKSVG